jgi:hypothetical protein
VTAPAVRHCGYRELSVSVPVAVVWPMAWLVVTCSRVSSLAVEAVMGVTILADHPIAAGPVQISLGGRHGALRANRQDAVVAIERSVVLVG